LYKLHLILKYLRKRRIAWVSLIAVMLCTAMVLIVISVMGGWLRMFRQTNHGLIGDLILSCRSMDGFSHYEELIGDLRQVPEFEAAAPLIRTGGVINIRNAFHSIVQVVGYDIKDVAKVNNFAQSLYWQPDRLYAKADEYQKQGALEDAAALRAKAKAFPSWDKLFAPDTYRDQLPAAKMDVSQWTGMIVGTNLALPRNPATGQVERPDWVYQYWVHLTVVPSLERAESGLSGSTVIPGWMVDDSHTKVFIVDANTVYLPFDVLQQRLNMDARPYSDKEGHQLTIPARCSEVEVKLKPGSDPYAAKPAIEQIVAKLQQKYPDMVSNEYPVTVENWDQRQSDILEAVEHEKMLLVILFAIISVVAIFLIFCIFFMIVVEKTRDIGIIKSVGATSGGVAAIFLGYGLTIGVIGAGMGLLLGYLVVHNINQLHAWMSQHLGVTVWNAKTYLFDTIPNTMETRDVVVIVTVAILSSVLGAVVPALRAARMNPVEALRWE